MGRKDRARHRGILLKQLSKNSKISDVEKLFAEFDSRDRSISKCMEYTKSVEELCGKLGEGSGLIRYAAKVPRLGHQCRYQFQEIGGAWVEN
jgi:hypothetical protein